MARNNETTTKFKVDISELKSAMQEARKQVAYANSEFKAASSSMDDWSKSSEGLNAKLKQLKSNLDSQETVLKEYENTLEEIKKQYGENSNEAREYATKLNNQQAVVNKIKKEMADYEDALEEVSNAEKIASKTGKDVAEVLDEVGKEADDAGEGFTVLKGAVAEFVGTGLSNLVGGVKDAIGSFMSLADETREYRTEMAKLDVAFNTAGLGAEAAKETYKDLYSVMADEGAATEAAQQLAKISKSESDLEANTRILTGVFAEYGNSIPLEGLAEGIAASSAMSSVQGSLADALEWQGINLDDFNAKLGELATEEERAAFIQSTLTDLYGESADQYIKNNASIIEANKAQSDYADTMAKMGEIIEPVTTTLKTGFTDLLNTALALFGGEVNVENFTTKLQEGFKILSDEVLPAVKDGLGWIKDNKDIIIAGLTGIATGFVAFNVASMIMTATTAIKGFTSGLTLAQVAMKAFNLVIGANPIGLLITIILSVVVAIGTFIATNEDAKKKFLDIWNKVVEGTKKAINTIGNFFTNTLPNFINTAVTYFAQFPNKVWTWLQNTIAKVTTWKNQMISNAQSASVAFINKIIEYVSQLPNTVWTYLSNTITKVSEFATNLANKASEAGKKFKDNLVDAVSGVVSKMSSIGSDIVDGIWSGISSGWDWLNNKVKNLASSLFESAKKALKINSPSKVFADEVGKWIPAGIAVGIDKNAKTALNSVKNLAMNTVGSARAGLSTGTTTLGGSSTGAAGVVNNFTQVINSPKQLSRLDIYRQSKNLLGYAGGGI